MLASSEGRVKSGLVALAGAVPFYLPGQQRLLQQLGRALDQAQVGGWAGAGCGCVKRGSQLVRAHHPPTAILVTCIGSC